MRRRIGIITTFAYLFTLPWMAHRFLLLDKHQVIAADLLFAAAAVVALIRITDRDVRTRLLRSRVAWGCGAFFAVTAAAALAGPTPEASKTVLLRTLYLVSVPPVLIVNLGDVRRAWIARAWLGGAALACAVAAWGVASYYVSRPTFAVAAPGNIPSGFVPRIQGPFHSPNTFCNYLIATLAVAAWCASRPIARGWAICCSLTGVFTLSPGLGALAVMVSRMWSSRLLRGLA